MKQLSTEGADKMSAGEMWYEWFDSPQAQGQRQLRRWCEGAQRVILTFTPYGVVKVTAHFIFRMPYEFEIAMIPLELILAAVGQVIRQTKRGSGEIVLRGQWRETK